MLKLRQVSILIIKACHGLILLILNFLFNGLNDM